MMPFWIRLTTAMAGMLISMLSTFAQAEDIDVFVGGTGGSGGQPNILVVLDNTSNWSRQSQKWPGGVTQGQSEVRAIKTAVNGLVGKVNIGLMEFTTEGTANQDGGFVRFDLQALTTTSQATLNTELDEIFNNIESPTEKRNSGTPYGNLMYDVYNYLAGANQSFSGAGTPPTLADGEGYSSKYATFASPLNAEDSCVKTYVIFIGNPNQNGPTADSSTNSTALATLYSGLGVEGVAADKLAGQSSGTPLPIPLFTTTNIPGTYTVPAGTESFYTTVQSGKQCYSSAADCTSALAKNNSSCPADSTCTCLTEPAPVETNCDSGSNYTVSAVTDIATTATTIDTKVTPTGQYNTTSGASWNLDDWAKFLNLYGVPVKDDEGVVVTRMPVVTYTIDVFNAQQNAEHTGLMMSTANVGGGKPFIARNEDAIVDAINTAASEILSASSTFAAVALPLSATNRAQNENQVFIGMFRPNSDASPRWFGNLKRYQVGLVNGKAELVGVNPTLPAINNLTNFPSECAQSFWSVDSGEYWKDKNVNPSPLSKCVGATTSPWSDAPDGPFVEKGGAAQALRNYPSATSPDITTRSVLTVGTTSGAPSLVDFDTDFASGVGGQSVVDYIRGQETIKLVTDGVESTVTRARPTIHGDVVHSRPLPINYGVASGDTTPTISVFFGTNDGLLRAIDAATGLERWSFVAPEHFGKLQRLHANSPLVAFPNQDMSATPTPLPKDYFFDGAIGSHLVYDNNNRVTTAYIFPTMRRGGRMVYAFDVTDPDEPEFLWRKGCPLPNSDVGCDTGFSGIGQTWSLPRSAKLKGYDSGNSPVVIFGGGYDNCEDTDAKVSGCSSSAKGRAIYVVDAEDGKLVATIPTSGSIVADISLVDEDYDGYTDYAYTVDLSGNVWRVSFIDPTTKVAVDVTSATWAATAATRIAYTSGGARKFLNAPSVLPYQGKVYLAFGSGNRERPLKSNYPYSQDVDDRYYVFLDYPTDNTAHDLDGAGMHDYTAPTSCETAGVYPSAAVDAKRGWFLSLPGRGEQVVTSSVIAGGVVAFNTFQPEGKAVGMCKRPMGISSSYQVNLFNASGAVGVDGHCGGKRSVEIGDGMPISPTVGTVGVDTDPSCTGNNCKEDTITFCIGCEGLTPTEIAPKIDQARARVYWGSDVDR